MKSILVNHVERIAAVAKGRGRPKKDRNDMAVKVDRSIASRAKIISAARGQTLAEYLSELLEGPISRDYAKEMRRQESRGIEEN